MEANFDDTINSMEQFRQQYLWQYSLIKIENKPIYLRNWFKKGIVQVKHIMKNASQFLGHRELQNRYDFHVCPSLYCGIIFALKNLMKTIPSVTTETNNITPAQKSFNKNLPIKKSLQNCIKKS